MNTFQPTADTASALDLLCCPACHCGLRRVQPMGLSCEGCGRNFPVAGGLPRLLTEESLFASDRTVAKAPSLAGAGRTIKSLLPGLQANVSSAANYRRLGALVAHDVRGRRGRVLVIGGAILGVGMEGLLEHPRVALVETDVVPGPRTQIICDAQQLPFSDGTFDAVIAQAVLPAVADPARAVAEIHRVLSWRGLIYTENSFMQPVWAGKFDFARFPPSGQRRLFREFDEIDSGVACGPGSALAKSWEYFLIAFARRGATRRILRVFARLTAFWLKWFDYLTRSHPAALDGAAGLYFLGRRREEPLTDDEVIANYRGYA